VVIPLPEELPLLAAQ